MGCVNKYMAGIHGCQVLAGTRSHHTAEEAEPDLGEPSKPLQNKHMAVAADTVPHPKTVGACEGGVRGRQ